MAVLAGVMSNQEATAQTANATTNATAAANQTGTSFGNLTSGDFSATRDNLEAARDAIFGNDTFTAFNALNDADNELYNTVGETPLLQQVTPLRDKINSAEDAVINQDLAKALQDANSASVELVKITKQLPSGEEE
jgi:hypothetical protein